MSKMLTLMFAWLSPFTRCFACALVIALEMANSALENLVKGHVSEPSEFAGRALDLSAGAVLVASIASVVIGALVFGERIVELLRSAD